MWAYESGLKLVAHFENLVSKVGALMRIVRCNLAVPILLISASLQASADRIEIERRWNCLRDTHYDDDKARNRFAFSVKTLAVLQLGRIAPF